MTSRKKPNEREQTPVGHGVEATPLPSELLNYMESEWVRTEEREDRICQEDRERMENTRQEDTKGMQQQFADLFKMQLEQQNTDLMNT